MKHIVFDIVHLPTGTIWEAGSRSYFYSTQEAQRRLDRILEHYGIIYIHVNSNSFYFNRNHAYDYSIQQVEKSEFDILSLEINKEEIL